MSQRFTLTNDSNWDNEIIHVTEQGKEDQIVKLKPGESHTVYRTTGAFSKRLTVDFGEEGEIKPFRDPSGEQVLPRVETVWETVKGERRDAPFKEGE